jgi:class 3 adenylate cyclase
MDQTTDATALSARQAEVAALYVDGLSYKEIARALDISPGTVRTHLNAIFQKLGVSSRTELGHRLSPPAVAPAKTQPEPAPPLEPRGPESRQLTFLFADIVGSTEMATRLDAEDMHDLLARFREMVRAVLARHGGHAAGFPGDGAVAVFGWPEAAEDAARRAAAAALVIVAAAPKIRTPEGEQIMVRVGVATGLAVVEGTEGRAEDFVGSAANLAARL